MNTLTCPKCAATWQVIKASDGPIFCPHCKKPIDGDASAQSPAVPLLAPVAEPQPLGRVNGSLGGLSVPDPAGPLHLLTTDDPELREDFADSAIDRNKASSGRHPLKTLLIILFILFILLPFALIAFFAVVCAITARW